jgi:DNA-binding LytR/AlgR family response regulator
MSQLNVLLVHRDPLVRQSLRELLGEADFCRVLGEAVTGEEALAMLEHIPYGVIFTAVDLPGEVSGVELSQALSGKKHKPAMVFIAEDETLAFTAFEMGATDYLLWPVKGERFGKTIQRLKQFRAHYKEIPEPAHWKEPAAEVSEEATVQVHLGDEDEDRFLKALSQAWDYTSQARQVDIEKLAVTMDGRTLLIPYTQIIFVEAYEDYSYVHTAKQKFLTSYRLKNLEDRLRMHRFFRVHRKYLVNLDMVTEIASLPGSNFMLRTAGKTRIELPISRRRIAELKKILGL